MTDLVPLPEVDRGAFGDISMDDQSIVYVDKEGHFLILTGVLYIHPL